VLLDDAAPLGLVVVLDDPEPVADGEVALLPDGVLTEPEPVVVVVVLLLPGVVAVPGDADGGVVRSGVLPTRSVSVRLQATLVPASSARAQKPESIFFIADAPPCGVEPPEEGATDMPAAAGLTGPGPSNTTAS
jgi:hypothetical protein